MIFYDFLFIEHQWFLFLPPLHPSLPLTFLSFLSLSLFLSNSGWQLNTRWLLSCSCECISITWPSNTSLCQWAQPSGGSENELSFVPYILPLPSLMMMIIIIHAKWTFWREGFWWSVGNNEREREGETIEKWREKVNGRAVIIFLVVGFVLCLRAVEADSKNDLCFRTSLNM